MSAFIHFYTAEREMARRVWFYVPRVGDEVMLGEDDTRQAYRVVRVVWGNDHLDFMAREGRGESQRVNIEIEEISND